MSVSFYASAPGREYDEFPLGPNFHNGNAYAVLSATGLVSGDGAMWDHPPVAIGTFREALVVALNDRNVTDEEIHIRLGELVDWADGAVLAGATTVYWG